MRTPRLGICLQRAAQQDARPVVLRRVAIRASEEHVGRRTGTGLDHLGEQPLRLGEFLGLQVGGAEEEGELGILGVDRSRGLEGLHRFLKLPVGHERLREQALHGRILLVAARQGREDRDGISGTAGPQVHD